MNEQVIDHEVRIRMLEKAIISINETLGDIKREMSLNTSELKKEMKSQFHWTLGLAFGFVVIVLLPIVCTEIIAIIKTIST